nr:TPM domain-containing protein [Corynebacterium aquatimens]
MRVVFIDSFGGLSPEAWAQQAVDANGANTAVLVVSPNESAYYVDAGEQWTQSEVDRMSAPRTGA